MGGWTNQIPLSLTVGQIPGEHVIIINPATGDALDVYDSANNLVLSIDQFGSLNSIDPGGGFVVELFESVIRFDLLTPVAVAGSISETFTPRSDLNLTSGSTFFGSGQGSSIDLLGPTGVGTNDETITATQRGGITGALLQSDQTGTNNLTHRGRYSCVTNASGIGTFAHGCGFTPTDALFTATGVVAATATQFSYQPASITATDITIAVKTFAGAAYNGTATFSAEFWG